MQHPDPWFDILAIPTVDLDVDPRPKWCIACGPSKPLLGSDPDYCETCDLHRVWRRQDAGYERSR